MDSPLGGIKRGWAEIRGTYERLFSTKAAFSFEFWDYTLHRGDDVFWVVGRERGQWVADEEVLDIAIRTSRLFRRVGERWRQVHHHGSIEDPECWRATWQPFSAARRNGYVARYLGQRQPFPPGCVQVIARQAN